MPSPAKPPRVDIASPDRFVQFAHLDLCREDNVVLCFLSTNYFSEMMHAMNSMSHISVVYETVCLRFQVGMTVISKVKPVWL